MNDIKDIDAVDAGSITEPVTLEEVKSHLKITFTDEDTYLSMLIALCRRSLEEYTCTSMVQKTVTIFGSFSEDLQLPYAPIGDLTSVHLWDGEAYETADTDDYQLHGEKNKYLCFNTCGKYKIVYAAGPASADLVPGNMKLALLNEIAFRYENHGDESGLIGVCDAARKLADPNRQMQWI